MSTHKLEKEKFKGHTEFPKTEVEILEKGGPRPGRFRCALVFCHCQCQSLFNFFFFLSVSTTLVLFRCAHLPDRIFSFTQCRVYKEGDHGLPEFPSYFQVAKYSVFERVSEFMHQSH